MNSRKLFYILISFFIVLSCEDNFHLDSKQIESTIIIKGWIYNDNMPVRLKISESIIDENADDLLKNSQSNCIKNALVTLTSTSQVIDTFELEFTNDYHDSSVFKWTGYYISDKIKGIPKETYFLKVEHGGKIYQAEAYMPAVPKIDSITFSTKQVEKENATLMVPMVNFVDPVDEENYYLFRAMQEIYDNQDPTWKIMDYIDPWMISLFSDRFINGKDASLNILEGVKTDRYWMEGSYNFMFNSTIGVRMQSMTKHSYEYYEVLINQLNYAAGVFHPASANPPTNISNGGQGYFGASAVSYCITDFPRE